MPLQRRIACAVTLSATLALISGCSISPARDLAPAVVATTLRGSIYGGRQPIAFATISLFAVGTTTDGGGSSLLTPAISSDANGNFNFTAPYVCPTQATPVFLVAAGGNPGLNPSTARNAAITLIAALGPCQQAASAQVNVNEMTTVAATAALYPYMTNYASIGSTPAHATALANAFTLAAQLVNVAAGFTPGTGVPAGSTVPAQKIATLADVLASCVNSAGGTSGNGSACGNLFQASGGAATTETTGAALYIAKNPTASVATLFGLAGTSVPFIPELPGAPNDWTIVLQTTPAITWGAIAAINYGVPLSSTQLNATAQVAGTFAYTPAAGTYLLAGTQPLSVTFTPTDTDDYTSPTVTNTVVVNNSGPSYQWSNVAIVGGGFVTGIVAHPTAQNVRYARTDVGGAYSWNQSTAAWVPLTDFYSRNNNSYGGCEAIGIDPTNSQKLYLAMGEYAESFGGNGQFLISSNQGASFTTVSAPFKMGSNDAGRHAGERFGVDPNLPSTIYYGTRLNGLYVSTNSGSNWSQVASFPVTTATPTSGVGVVFIDFVTSSGSSGSATPVIYVGVSDTGTSSTGYLSLYRSINAGSTWTAVPGQPSGFYPAHGMFGADGNLYLTYGNQVGPDSITSGAVYQYVLPAGTSPGGNGTWNNITPKSPVRQSGSQGGFGGLTLDPEVPGVIMVSTMDDYYPGDDIYRSTNYGSTWVSLNQQGKTHNFALSPWVTFGGTSTGTGNWPGTLLIDPFNSNHMMYGNGQTIWDSTNIQQSDAGKASAFSIGAAGLEETVVQALISPPTGPYVVSGTDDLGGFVHTSLTASPSGGMMLNPILNQASSLDFAQGVPATMVRVGQGSSPWGAYSTNSGSSWTPFAAAAPGTSNGAGSVAISASAATILWAPSDTSSVYYSTNNGTTWTASTGAIGESKVVADRLNASKFYIYSGTTLQISTNGGVSFTTAKTGLPSGGSLIASYAAEGDLWLATGSGLMHSTNSGSSFTTIGGGITQGYAVSLGAASTTGGYPTLYLVGVGSSGYGFYRSTNSGTSWILMNDTAHQWGYVQFIAGDPKTFGRFYLGTGGRGVITGYSAY